MLIRFLRDFRSAATGERFYQAGEVADLERGAEVVAEGAAEPVEPAQGAAGDESAPARTKRGRK